MVKPERTILIVEDDPDVAEMLTTYFDVHGYHSISVGDGEQALDACRLHRPDLVILDIRLPDMDGYEVARRLRINQRTVDIPIIFLTEKRSRVDRLHGLGIGVEDFISKPFDIQELRLRVRNAMQRSVQPSLTNPVTSLPEGFLVEERLQECLESADWALLLVSFDNLDRFREAYGFVASDDVLRAASMMINNAVNDLGCTDDFIGHYGPTTFLLVTAPRMLSPLRDRIQNRLEQSIDYFYPLEDRLQESFSKHKLKVRLSQLEATQGSFPDISALKAAL